MTLHTNLISHYLLQDDALDSHGSNDGTISGGLVFNGDSASFDGVDDYISTPTMGLTSTFTISLWVKRTNEPHDTLEYAIGFPSSPSNGGIYVGGVNATYDYIGISDGSGSRVASTTPPIVGTRYNVVFTQNASNLNSLYIDGVFINSFVGVNIDLSTLNIGRRPDAVFNIESDISNIRIYSDEKDQVFIDDLFNEGYNPSLTTDVTASVTITAIPLTQPITADVTASVDITATPLIKSYSSLFTVVQEIQQTSPETIFRVIQEIEQPITTTIIQRVNA